ncbi:MAG: SpoIIE family protein phosphatase [Lentisphaeria bacterium]|nr:SpoIIE family protein phosphatase [Lentisphaeria bacterium]
MKIPFPLILIAVGILIFLAVGLAVVRTRLALSRQRLRVAMRNNVEISNFLSLFSQNMKSKQNMENWMNVTARYVMELVEAQSVCVFALENGMLRPVGVSGPFPLFHKATSNSVMTKPKYLLEQLKSERIAVGQGIVGEAAKYKREIMLGGKDLERAKLYVTDPLVPIECIMALPLISEGEVTGVICAVNNTQEGETYFTPEQFGRFRFITGQVVLARRIIEAYSKLSEQQRLNQELDFARKLQRSMLPETVPVWGQFSVHAYTRASKEVSGDFYDFVQIDEDRLLVVIGDACGKGIPACMITSMTRSFIRANMERYTSLMDLMLELNTNLHRDTGDGRYITLGCCVLNRRDSTLEYVRGGHTELLVYIREHIRAIYPDGAGIGLLPTEAVEFDTLCIEFTPEMSVMLFTDGINEAVAPRTGEYFGVPRLKELYRTASIAKEEPETFIRRVFNAVDEFAQTPGGEGQEDDQTIVLIHHI